MQWITEAVGPMSSESDSWQPWKKAEPQDIEAQRRRRIETIAKLLSGVTLGKSRGAKFDGLVNKIVAVCLPYLDTPPKSE